MEVYFVIDVEEETGVDAVEIYLDWFAPFSFDWICGGDDECFGFAGEENVGADYVEFSLFSIVSGSLAVCIEAGA